MSTRQPWFCPSCQKHHGPHVDTCPAPTWSLPGSPIISTGLPSPATSAGVYPKPWSAVSVDGDTVTVVN